MHIEPLRKGLEYGHSWPLIEAKHWWLTLTATDQAAWFGSIANCFVVVATGITAWVAYRLGSRDAREREYLRDHSADIAAGLLFTSIASLRIACSTIKKTVNNSSVSPVEMARILSVTSQSVRRFLGSIDKKLIADFSVSNKEMALTLAFALGRIELLPDLCEIAIKDLKERETTTEKCRQSIFNSAYEFYALAAPFVRLCQDKFTKPMRYSELLSKENRPRDDPDDDVDAPAVA